MPQVKPYIVGNWKMHGDAPLARSLTDISKQAAHGAAEIVLCPPSVWLAVVAGYLKDSAVKLGGQDCHAEATGAFTGDISAPMLKEIGCSYVIVGHSERRAQHGEDDALVSKKATAALKAGLTPIICIGETEAERKSGKAKDIVGKQVKESLPADAAKSHFLLAYEPVWAIGSGLTPTSADIQDMHAYIMDVAQTITGSSPAVLYGGSVKAGNAAEILKIPGVAGVLVGGASVKADEFTRIIDAAKEG